MKNDDAQLIQRILDGDDTAFSTLVGKYQKSVHALAWRKIGDFHIAEEITQDTFLKAYQKLSTLKEPQSFASWLYVITANHCKAWLRKKRTRTQSLENTSNTQLEKRAYSGYIIEENKRMAAETQREVVKKLLAKLQDSDRTIITLYYLAGMTYDEISKFLGVSEATIRNRLYRARRRLKKEEPMIREALENYQISPNLTENIMQEISRLKPVAPSGSKPLVPWAVGVSTSAVVLLMLGIGNHQYLSRFQKPYSFDATSEMTVEIIEAPIVLNLEVSKPDIRTQLGNVSTPSEGDTTSQQPNDVSASVAEVESDETSKNPAHWKLPKAAKARFGKGGITTIQFSPDGTLLAVGSRIGVWLYDVETGEEKSLFGGGMCDALRFSPDGRFLTASSEERLIQLWEIATEREVPLIDLYGSASVLRFSSDGKTLIGLSSSGAITRLNIENGKGKTKHLKTGLFGTGLFSSEDFRGVYAMTSDKIALGKESGVIQLWDVATRRKLSTLRGHLRGHADLPLQLLDKPPPQGWPFKNWVLAVAFSPDGTKLASGGADNTVRLWDTTGDRDSMTLQKHTGSANVLAFSPDGKMLASGSYDTTVQLWDTTTGEPLATLTGHITGIDALAFSPDGNTLASGSRDGTIRFWDVAAGTPLDERITGHIQSMKTVTFFRDSSTLASAAFNGKITFWDVETAQKSTVQNIGHRDWYSAVAFSPDGTKLVSESSVGTIVFSRISITNPDNLIRLTDVWTGDALATLRQQAGKLIFSPDDRTKTVATTTRVGVIRLWNTETGDEMAMIKPGFRGKMPMILALAFSPDGRWLVSGTIEGEIRMWDVATGEALTVFAEPMEQENLGAIGALAFSPDRALLAAGTHGYIHLWDVHTGHKRSSIHTVHKRGRTTFHDRPGSLVFSPDGTILVSGQNSGTIQLWDVKTGDRIAALDGHAQQVETLKFSPDGEMLVSTAQDGTIFLWDWDEAITEPR